MLKVRKRCDLREADDVVTDDMLDPNYYSGTTTPGYALVQEPLPNSPLEISDGTEVKMYPEKYQGLARDMVQAYAIKNFQDTVGDNERNLVRIANAITNAQTQFPLNKNPKVITQDKQWDEHWSSAPNLKYMWVVFDDKDTPLNRSWYIRIAFDKNGDNMTKDGKEGDIFSILLDKRDRHIEARDKSDDKVDSTTAYWEWHKNGKYHGALEDFEKDFATQWDAAHIKYAEDTGEGKETAAKIEKEENARELRAQIISQIKEIADNDKASDTVKTNTRALIQELLDFGFTVDEIKTAFPNTKEIPQTYVDAINESYTKRINKLLEAREQMKRNMIKE